ncbi:hypothetical protein TNIN_293971 [Trichonephila inaurata madagascariensis]|uniref:Uncharacterized protein n=1 Tax=Trichonephila inaurata madagascariensis TaxID=2747483 RepID=A0A8X6Y3R2_9ARAC|nr:hypothetical protein TNIN_293971 [Trichonephila inaurata madagascariensis]
MLNCGNTELIRLIQMIFHLEIQPEEPPIAAVGTGKVSEPSTRSEVPVAYTDQEVNPELTKVTPLIDNRNECEGFQNYIASVRSVADKGLRSGNLQNLVAINKSSLSIIKHCFIERE